MCRLVRDFVPRTAAIDRLGAGFGTLNIGPDGLRSQRIRAQAPSAGAGHPTTASFEQPNGLSRG